MTILGRSILIKPDPQPESSVIITDTEVKLSEYATIEEVGTDVTAELSSGDRIFFNNRSGRFIKLDDIEYLLISVDDVFIRL